MASSENGNIWTEKAYKRITMKVLSLQVFLIQIVAVVVAYNRTIFSERAQERSGDFLSVGSRELETSINVLETNVSARKLKGRRHFVCNGEGEALRRKPGYENYFEAMKSIYSNSNAGIPRCISEHARCGFPPKSSSLPTFVLSIGLEGAGHHLWTEIFQKPVFDCVWTNARHYWRDIGPGVPRRTVSSLAEGLKEQLLLKQKMSGGKGCQSIYDSEDSFPTGSIRREGRVFMHPDLINLQVRPLRKKPILSGSLSPSTPHSLLSLSLSLSVSVSVLTHFNSHPYTNYLTFSIRFNSIRFCVFFSSRNSMEFCSTSSTW